MGQGYTPVDLSQWRNATVADYQRSLDETSGSALEERTTPPTGSLQLRGLPFDVGDGSGAPCFVVPSRLAAGAAGPVPIGSIVEGVVVAHVLLGSDIWSGSPVGRVVAEYAFHHADGQVTTIPIRERFEIGNIPLPWGQYPVLCVPDRQDEMEDQWQGQFERAGFRQTEVQPSSPAAYYLWYWRNPRPDVPLDSLSLAATHPGVFIAGVTVGHVAEDPVRLRTRVTARVRQLVSAPTLGVTTGRSDALGVRVDRGVATYPEPLPQRALDDDPTSYPGWGSASVDRPESWAVDVAATGSATISVSRCGIAEDFAWGDVCERGSVRGSTFELDIIDRGRNWMTLTVIDAIDGRPVPCRIAVQTTEGVPFAPHGHHARLYSGLETWNVDVGGDVRLGNVTYAYIDGTAQGWMPRGDVVIDIARGFEYEPLRVKTTITPGQRELTFSISRWTDMNALGWYSGDTHVHFVSAQGALLEAAGEDLNVVNLLQTQWGHLFTSTEEFTGGPHVTPDGRHIVWVAQENREHLLGHLGLLGLVRPVMPWTTGGPGEGELGGGLETTESRWADAAHEQGATVVLAHFPTPNAEAPAMVATGRADAIEMYDDLEYEHAEYYRYLNDGYRLPLVAGTDKMASSVPVGMFRTYARIEDGATFDFDRWTSAIRAGRTFITSGPMLRISVDGHDVGSTIHVAPGQVLDVECEANGFLPFHSLQLISLGQVVEQVITEEPQRTLRLRTHIRVDGPMWLAARCGGPGYSQTRHHDRDRRGIMAHTSPIYVAVGDEYRLRSQETQEYMLQVIALAREYVRKGSPQFPSGSITHHHGHDDHLAFLEEPLIEAERSIRGRGR